MRRVWLTAVILLLAVLVVVGCRWGLRSSTGGPSLVPAAVLIARGRYLATAADCMACHTRPGHPPFSGGLVIPTKFGPLVSTNITPDKATGIGGWSGRQFYRALHEGIAPGHDWLVFPHYLYPAMPYTAYTKLRYADVMAIKAYLDSLTPVYAPDAPDHLRFPYNQRPLLLVWRVLFFTPGPMRMNPQWSIAVQNGAYLTMALGHCGECHTPRNLLQASLSGKALAGAAINGFFAPNISSSRVYGIGAWSQANLVAYLHAGGNNVTGSAYGPMRMVVQDSTSRLSVSDIEDMAAYLQQATIPQSPKWLASVPDASASIARGAALYASRCAMCHGAEGGGMGEQMVPNLSGNSSLTAGGGENIIRALLAGLPPWRPNGLAMPAFGRQLSNQQIADISNYLRTAWGNKGIPSVTKAQVAEQRGQGVGR